MKTFLQLLCILCLSWAFSSNATTHGQRVVACIIVGEAGIEGTNGMMAVAEVIHNRANEKGKSPLAIVTKPHAFSCINNRDLDQFCRSMMKRKEYPIALALARIVYNEPEKLPGITKGATYFHTTNTQPPWAKGVKPIVTLGKHHFYDSKGIEGIHR